MNRAKVIKVDSDGLEFEGGIKLYSEHDKYCCESHYLDFTDISLVDFEGLEFDLTGETFFDRINGYGIALKPLSGHPVRIPGYSDNSGYYSSELELVLSDGKGLMKFFDISECQAIV